MAKIPGLDGVEVFGFSEFLDMVERSQDEERIDQFSAIALAYLLSKQPGMSLTLRAEDHNRFESVYGATNLHYHMEPDGAIRVTLEPVRGKPN